MRRVGVQFLLCIWLMMPASADTWWHDGFVWEESSQPCGDNDSISTYSAKSVDQWETYCKIEKTTGLIGLEGVILDMRCSAEGDEDLGKRRQLLLNLSDGRIASYPPLKTMKRCSSMTGQAQETPQPKQVAASEKGCEFNKRLYRRSIAEETAANSYQELQFTTGLVGGDVELTEFRSGRAVWRAHATHVCSNGAVICRLEFARMLGGSLSLPYEAIGDERGDPDLIVIPSLQQEVYQTERSAVPEGKGYGGLVADLLNGFVPSKDELVTPYNIYRYAGCMPD